MPNFNTSNERTFKTLATQFFELIQADILKMKAIKDFFFCRNTTLLLNYFEFQPKLDQFSEQQLVPKYSGVN